MKRYSSWYRWLTRTAFTVAALTILYAPAQGEQPATLGIPYSPKLLSVADPFENTAKRFPAIGVNSAWLNAAHMRSLATRTVWDSSGTSITTSRFLFDKPFGIANTYSLEQYKKYRFDADRKRIFKEITFTSITTARAVEKDAVEIQIPLKVKSKVFQRVFGGDKVGLRVNGELSINGEIRKEATDRVISQQGQQQNTNFKMDQRQRFTITGNIGDKVTVRIDQDSERLFEFENAVKLEYTGTEDEIIQKIEAGNISLELPGTQLATFSGQNKGLFGLKAIAKAGPLKVTTIASLEKGKKNKLKANSGEQLRQVVIKDVDYVHNQFFAIDTLYLDGLRRFDANMALIGTPALAVQDIRVYVSTTTNSSNSELPVRGYAFANPPDHTTFRPTDSVHAPNEFTGNFVRLGPEKYTFEPITGRLLLAQALGNEQILGVTYRRSNGDQVGSFDPVTGGTEQYVLLKLLRGPTENTSSAVWNLMLRNGYSLQGGGVTPESFEATMFDSRSQNAVQSFNNVYFTKMLGVDNFSKSGTVEPNGDGFVDNAVVNFNAGVIWFPNLRPFAPTNTDLGFYWNGWFRGGEEQISTLDTAFQSPQLYSQVSSGVSSRVSIDAKLRSRSNVIQLGIAVLENSEEITVGSRRLVRGSDYTIDYYSGTLTILDPAATAPGANLEVAYESGEIFQLDRKTLLGVRAEYELWDDSFVGFTFLSQNEKPLDKRIRIGNEPLSNKIWDVNTRLNFKPGFLTKAMDALPIVSTEEPSKISFEGEFAQVFPNPNSMSNDATGDQNGVAFIDDFESSKRTVPLALTRRSWQLSAYPPTIGLEVAGDTLSAFPAKIFNWYNPFDQERIRNIWPNREVNSNVSNTIQTLVLRLNPWFNREIPTDSVTNPRASWGAVTRYLGGGYSNQQEAKYIEFWAKTGNIQEGKLFIDFGHINENVIPNNSQRPSTEDRNDNKIIDNDAEDTGLDQVHGNDPPLVGPFSPGDPFDFWDFDSNGTRNPYTLTLDNRVRNIFEPYSFDNFDYGNRYDYSHINGTENNKLDEGGGYPDTEDLNGSTSINGQDDFYRLVVDLSDRNSRYIAGGSPGSPWRLYRIPITDTIPVGAPNILEVTNFRIGLTGVTHETELALTEINIVGNEWRPPGLLTQQRDNYPLEADVVNTYDNASYEPPPGVIGYVDPTTDVRQKEQALRLKINALPSGTQSYLVKKLYEPINLLEYNRLKLFIRGQSGSIKTGIGQTGSAFGQYDLYFKLRIAPNETDSTRSYYEISKRIYPGWDPRNQIDITLGDLPTMKYERRQRALGTNINPDSIPVVRLLPDGTELRVFGKPSLQTVRLLMIAIENRGRPVYPEDQLEVWADELRVSDVKRTPGIAYRLRTDVDMAKIFTLSAALTHRDGNFRTVSEKTGSHTSNLAGTFNASLKTEEFIPKSWGITAPISATFSQTLSKPDYLPGDDIAIDRLTGKSQPIWTPFWKYLNNLDPLAIRSGEKNPDTLLTFSKGYSFGLSNLSRTTQNEKWWEKWFANRFAFTYNHAENYSSDASTRYSKDRTRSSTGSFTLPIEQKPGIKLFAWTSSIPILKKISETELGYLPSSFSISAQGQEQTGSRLTRERTISDKSWTVTGSRGFRTSYRFLQNMTIDYSFDQRLVGVRSKRDRIKTAYASAGLNLRNTQYPDSLALYPFPDSTNGIQPRSGLFEKIGGYSMIVNDQGQRVGTNWAPSILSWLGTDFKYSTQYKWSWGGASGVFASQGRSVSSLSNADMTYTLRLKQLFKRQAGAAGINNNVRDYQEKTPERPIIPPPSNPDTGKEGFGKDPKAQSNPDLKDLGEPPPLAQSTPQDTAKPVAPRFGRQRTGQVGSDTAKTTSRPSSSTPATSKPSPLQPFWALIDRLDDISVSMTRNRSYSRAGVEHGAADWKYQLGISNDPKLNVLPGFTSIPATTLSREYTTRSGLKITNDITATLDHSWSKSQQLNLNPTESIIKSVFLLDNKSGAPKPIDAPNFGIRWTGLEAIGPWKDYTQSVSLENGYQTRSTTNFAYRNRVIARDTTKVRYVTAFEYSKSWNPLIGISITFKNKVTTTARYTSTQTFNERDASQRNRTSQSSILVSAGYTMQQGFTLPLSFWPFNNKRFKNQTDFSLNYNSTKNSSESSRLTAGQWGSYTPLGFTSTYTVAPKITVTFSRTVTGYVAYEFGESESQTSGKTRINSLKFNVNIQIRG